MSTTHDNSIAGTPAPWGGMSAGNGRAADVCGEDQRRLLSAKPEGSDAYDSFVA